MRNWCKNHDILRLMLRLRCGFIFGSIVVILLAFFSCRIITLNSNRRQPNWMKQRLESWQKREKRSNHWIIYHIIYWFSARFYHFFAHQHCGLCVGLRAIYKEIPNQFMVWYTLTRNLYTCMNIITVQQQQKRKYWKQKRSSLILTMMYHLEDSRKTHAHTRTHRTTKSALYVYFCV